MKKFILVSLLMSGSVLAVAQDSTAARPGHGRRGMDKFIDADGDGICDHRASAVGFSRGECRGAAGNGQAKKMKEQSTDPLKEGPKKHRGKR